MIRFATLGVALVILGPAGVHVASEPGHSIPDEVRRSDLAAECERLYAKGPAQIGGWTALTDWIDTLAAEHDRAALREIIERELPGHWHAAQRYAEMLGPREGVRYARTLRPGSRGWRQVVWTLSFTNALEVRAYVGEVARLPRRPVVFCLDVDEARGWGDLTDVAWRFVDDEEYTLDESHPEERFCDFAHRYLTKFEKARPVPPRRPQVIPAGGG